MFGGKREKALAEENARLKETVAMKNSALELVGRQKDEIEEQFTALVAANAQLEQDLTQAKKQLLQMKELSEENKSNVTALYEEYGHTRELAQKAETAQENFYQEVKTQTETVAEIVEKNKHFTTPMKVITEFSEEYKTEREALYEQLEQMLSLSKNMGVLALNAAIEAGRMGESGRKFIASAENIRTFADEYHTTGVTVKQQIEKLSSRVEQLEEQGRHLSQLLKDNNISMGKILKAGNNCILDYEKHKCTVGQLASKGQPEKLQDVLEKENEIVELGQQMNAQIEKMSETFEEQKNCTNGMEQAFEWIQHAVREG